LIADDDIPNYGTAYQQVDDSTTTIPTATSLHDILSHEVLMTLINYGFLAFCDMCIQVLIPLMWSTSVEYGGLGFTPHTIGLTLGGYCVINAFAQFMFLGRIIRRFGPRRVYIVCFSTFLVSNLCFVGEGFFARQVGGADWRVWAIIAVQLCTDTLKYASYGELLR
jgi:MFS family permease